MRMIKPMTFTLKTLSGFVASATILLGTFPMSAARHPASAAKRHASAVKRHASAAKRPASSARSAGLVELQLQVLLDRAGFSPGEIDGAGGRNSRKALEAFLASHKLDSGLASGAQSRQALRKALGGDAVEPIVPYTISEEDAAGPFTETIPQDMTEKSKLPGLYYTSVLEELGEKFHSSAALLKRLNPGARFIAGESIRVPNVLIAEPAPPRDAKAAGSQSKPASKPNDAKAAGPRRKPESNSGQNGKPASGGTATIKVVVSKTTSALTVYGNEGKVIFYAPVTSGSEHDPLPLGNWVVTQVRRKPVFNYNPDLFWDAEPASTKAQIPAGPNNPVGVVWIEISKPHYGIHGSPEPGRIGYSESHGCVRLTNWDALRLADLVKEGTPVVFEE